MGQQPVAEILVLRLPMLDRVMPATEMERQALETARATVHSAARLAIRWAIDRNSPTVAILTVAMVLAAPEAVTQKTLARALVMAQGTSHKMAAALVQAMV